MRRHNRALFRTARAILRDDTEAEDVLQEAYLQAYRAIGAFRGKAKLSTWPARIVANEALRRVRKRARRAELVPLDPGPSESEINEIIADHARAIIERLGEDLSRSGLAATPARFAKFLRYLAGGYAGDLASTVGSGVFPAEGEGPVVMRDIGFYSLCEHHLLPFPGHIHVGYLPSRRIIGLSKIPRIVDLFARRFQVQERLTEQVADALVQTLGPKRVVVISEAQHLCMAMRGVQKQGSSTTVRATRGACDQLLAMMPRS